MTRILRLLLIAAVAWPLCHPAAAQEVISTKKVDIKHLQLKEEPLSEEQSGQSLNRCTVNALNQTITASSTQNAPVLKDFTTETFTRRAKFTVADVLQGITAQQNSYVPVSGYYYNEGYDYYNNYCTQSQIIYPEDMLGGIEKGAKIKSLTFYTNSSGIQFGNNSGTSGALLIGLGNCDNNYFSTNSATSFSGEYVSGTVSPKKGETEFTVTFDSPFIYNGGNLLVYVILSTSGQYGTTSFLGVKTNTYQSNYARMGSRSRQYFLPKMTLDYEYDCKTPVSGDKTFFEGKSYTWGDGKSSDLSKVATDPDQIIAMLRKIYTDPTIPGNLKRGFDENGVLVGSDIHSFNVPYMAAGTLTYNNSTIGFDDTYGWGIPCDIAYGYERTSPFSDLTYDIKYWFMNPEQYKPDEDGVTLILLELQDDFSPTNVYEYQTDENGNLVLDENDKPKPVLDEQGNPVIILPATQINENLTGYDLLKEYISKTIKSARVITESKRTGNVSDFSSGTLFKIDCDKMNKFYLIGKGQLQWYRTLPFKESLFFDFYGEPCYVNGNRTLNDETTTYDEYIDPAIERYFLLGHMFEQFSPAMSQTGDEVTGAKSDIYQELVNMESFGVDHDCPNVPLVGDGHHFMMYGSDSKSDDCQDVRDMMFFVPDYRMMDWDGRGVNGWTLSDDVNVKGQDYFKYHPNHKPTMGLYVIRQDEITPTTQADDYYMLQLNWRTNLDDFLPSDEQEFELLQVVVDEETGEEKYVPVYYMNAQGQYTDADGNPSESPVPIILVMEAGRVKNYPNVYVARQTSSQQVTYAIRGRDAADAEGKHFLSLQISNQQSYIIPGLDPNEMIALKDASHYSRYNPDNEKNCYSNRINIANTALGLENANITDGESGTKLTVVRSHSETVNGVTNTISEPVAYITFNNHAASNRSITITMDKQSAKSDYPKGKSDVEAGNVQYYAGYHANNGNVEGNGNWSQNYNVTNTGYVDFGNLNIYDNFVVDVAGNTHPASYAYRLESNYQGTPTMVYLNAPSPYTKGDEVWYAWTWNNDNDGKWLLGTAGENGLLSFGPVKSNIIFARMNPNADGIPRWNGNGETGDDRAVWDQTGNLTANAGKTFSINGWLTGEWGSDVINETAYSNAFRVPIYKTASEINNAFSLIEVKGDKNHAIKVEDLTFSERVQYSSKTEILRYDVYRWPAGETRYIVNTVGANDAEQDLAPDGIAGNQGEGYTVTMNDVDGDYYYHGGEIAVSSGYAWAKFVDYYPAKVAQSTAQGEAYIYAPVVETFSVGKNVVGAQRTDYNTYGGPLQKAAVGVLDIDNPVYQISDYSWLKGNDRYAYYTVELPVKTDLVPTGYKIYMIRAWRVVDPSLLDEPMEAFSDRKSGDYMFEEMLGKTEEGITEFLPQGGDGEYQPGTHMRLGATQVAAQNVSGEDIAGVYRGTFGARKVRTATGYNDGTIEDLKMNFRVRLYFTPEVSAKGAAPKAADSDKIYYIAEYTTPFTIKGGITTGLESLNARQVVGVKYYNVAGIESDTPFQGVNIMVTRYSDGSSTTTKILK